MDNDELLKKVQKDYYRINLRWMHFHLQTMLLLSFLVFIVEIAMFFVLSDKKLITTSVDIYLYRYFILPSAFNGIFTALSFLVCYKTKISDKLKQYFISLSFVSICFVISVVHCTFTSVYSIFAFCVILTIIYADIKLTSIISIICLITEYISAMHTNWDSDKIYYAFYSLDILVSMIILLCIYISCVIIIIFENKKQSIIIKNDYERHQLKQEILRDDLTNTFNKSALQVQLNKITKQTQQKTYYLVMFDIDNFKQINDTYGHLKGDEVIKCFGNILNKSYVENQCIPFRFGGDEFCILFIDKTQEEVIEKTKTIQTEFYSNINIQNSELKFSASAGISKYSKDMTPSEFLEKADTALYRSKNEETTSIYIFSNNEFFSV